MELRLLVVSIYPIRKELAHRLKRTAEPVSLRRLLMIKEATSGSLVAHNYG